MSNLKPLRICKQRSCNELTRNNYCEVHSGESRHKEYDRFSRSKERAKIYNSSRWRKVRDMAINRDYGLCKHCGSLADMVDHIVPVAIDVTLAFDLENLQSLCNKCHAIKTANDERKYTQNFQ